MTTTDLSLTLPTMQELHALAARENIKADAAQYVGDAATISVALLSAEDAAKLRVLYQLLQNIYQHLHENINQLHEIFPKMPDFLQEQRAMEILDNFRSFGMALKNTEADFNLRKALHDLRGGSLVALFMHLDLLVANEATEEDCARVYILARDHLKIMRNVAFDLDPAGYNRDLQPMEHHVQLLREKWDDTAYCFDSKTVHVVFDCSFKGSVSERCMEFAALDRVIYNLVNNAAKYAVNQEVHLRIFALDDSPHTQLRFVVHNEISPEHRETLAAKFGHDLGQLFSGGFTTGGHGVGMRICADFVMHGYGLCTVEEALAGGYLGIALIRNHFVAWFHWAARTASE